VQEDWKSVGSYGTVGLEFAVSVLVGFAGGRWLDRYLGTDPWFLIIASTFGLMTGARFLWRALKRANQEADAAAEKEQAALKEIDDHWTDAP
jgi:ATP synthase protein I